MVTVVVNYMCICVWWTTWYWCFIL